MAALLSVAAPCAAGGPPQYYGGPEFPLYGEERDAGRRSAAGEGSRAKGSDAVPVGPSLSHTHSMTNGGELFAEPEQVSALQVSNRDVNRINCPGPLDDVFFSQEKPVTVTPDGQGNLFVKFLAEKTGATTAYLDDPADLHVVCDGAVYTMILHPRPIDSVTVRLGRKPIGVEETVKEWGALPIEDRIKRLTLAIWHNEVPPGFTRTRGGARPEAATRLYNDMMIEPLHTLRGPGSGLRATEYSVRARRPLTLEERYFLRPEFGDVIAITVDPLVLYEEGERSRLIVVERVVRNGR